MNHLELLKKYMAHVITWEGQSFARWFDGTDITEEEQEELKKLARELGDDNV